MGDPGVEGDLLDLSHWNLPAVTLSVGVVGEVILFVGEVGEVTLSVGEVGEVIGAVSDCLAEKVVPSSFTELLL